MSDNILSRKYIDISFNSTGDAPVNIDFTNDYPSPIIDNQGDYDLTIIRFKLPSSNVPKFLFKTGVTGHLIYMQYGTTSNSYAIPSDDSYEFYSHSEFLDLVNRSMMMCYNNFYRTINPAFSNNGDYPNNLTFTNNTPISINHGAQPDATQAVYFKLNISNVSYSGTAPTNMRLTLLVCGKQSVVFQNYSIQQLQQSGLTFHDGGQWAAADPTGNNKYPVEPFSKLYYGASFYGSNWQLKLEADNSYHVNMTVNFSIAYANPNQITPIYPPFFSIDSNQYLVLNYSPLWYKSNFQVGFNPQMKALFNYYAYAQDPSQPIYYITLPQQIFTDTTTEQDSECSIQLKQMNSSLYLFNMVDRIEFSTQISVESEIGKSAGSFVSVLTDFAPDPSAPLDYYIFNASNTYRRYKLLSNNALRRITLTAWVVYTDDTRRIMTIGPHETANIKLALIPSNWT